jgi:hypothetical protein
MKPLTMPDNGWTQEDKDIVCNALWSGKYDHIIDAEPMRVESYETVAREPRVGRPTRNYRAEIGADDAQH